MSNQSYIINSCQVSGSKNLIKILDLGYLPPVNISRGLHFKKKQELYFPTELLYSKTSKLFQLSCIVDKEILFPKSYPYTSSTTKILRDNFEDLYKELKKKKILDKFDLLVDIGSNDGNLLQNFKKYCKILGVTPENIGKLAIKKGIPTLIEYFSKDTVKKILNKFQKAKVITATNVFAHIDEPNKLLKNISKVLLPRGIFIIEVHYFCSLVKNIQYDTIYHEHMRYYSLQSLNYLLNKNNFKIFDAKLITTHGGSIRIYASQFKNYKCTNRL
jgi:SAM-dependent methyltransferase